MPEAKGLCRAAQLPVNASPGLQVLPMPFRRLQVCVEKAQRRKGIAKRMLQGYRMMVQSMLPQVRSMHLICKQDLIELYRSAGFDLIGPSEVVHGKDQWYEMRQALDPEGDSD